MASFVNTRTAPVIKWHGDKFNHQGTYDSKKEKGYRFYQMPIKLMSYLYSIIPGKHGNVIKLITFLIGSGESLGVSERLVEERTGLSHQAYCAARKWLLNNYPTNTYVFNDKKNHIILLDYDLMWQDQREYEERGLAKIREHAEYLERNARVDAMEYKDIADETRMWKSEYSFDAPEAQDYDWD